MWMRRRAVNRFTPRWALSSDPAYTNGQRMGCGRNSRDPSPLPVGPPWFATQIPWISRLGCVPVGQPYARQLSIKYYLRGTRVVSRIVL